MAVTTNIFVDGNATAQELAAVLEELAGIRFEQRADEYESWFESANDDVLITLGGHDFVDDADLDFESYALNVSVRAWNKDTEELRDARRTEWTNRLVDALKATRRFRLLVTKDVSRRLETYDPHDEVAP